ncbi:MAG: hypothetical protein JSU81_08840 [Candidatus Coatesbacteria bacterium]|nr:MAG: hypothetical protein JSU81_08840 [Candidatus Coatesbacteria bacterium]
MKRRYEKPTIGSERVFSLAAQACDVDRTEGLCPQNITYEPCYPFSWKVQNLFCGQIPDPPVIRS